MQNHRHKHCRLLKHAYARMHSAHTCIYSAHLRKKIRERHCHRGFIYYRIIFREVSILLPVIFKQITKPFACEENAALDSAQRHFQTFGDLFIFIACNVHGERTAVICGKTIENSAYLSGCKCSVGSLHSRILR